MRVLFTLALAFAGLLPSQTLENNGKPMRLPLQCGDEEIKSFGLTCPPDQPCPVYLELSAIEAVGNRLFAIGNLHTESITLYSVLLSSEDGKTWREPAERIRSGALDQIQFFDLETGWIAGQILLASPRDPFFLLTNDGGKTWRSRPVYSESKVGTIEQFVFDSKTTGLLWIDRTRRGDAENRYELYESKTGGESWMLREVSQSPIARKPKPAANAGWKLQANAATRSYLIEKHAAGKWETVASFLIPVGECKETEVNLPEPPAPEPQASPTAPQP